MPISPKVLKTKEPFKHFHQHTVEDLAKTVLGVDCKKGERIFSIGDVDEREVYLLSGSVRLDSVDNKTIHINQNDPEAVYGLSAIKPRKYSAIADSYNTCVLYVHDKILNYLIKKNKEQSSGEVVPEIILE